MGKIATATVAGGKRSRSSLNIHIPKAVVDFLEFKRGDLIVFSSDIADANGKSFVVLAKESVKK